VNAADAAVLAGEICHARHADMWLVEDIPPGGLQTVSAVLIQADEFYRGWHARLTAVARPVGLRQTGQPFGSGRQCDGGLVGVDDRNRICHMRL
jgi:hypothetical protein